MKSSEEGCLPEMLPLLLKISKMVRARHLFEGSVSKRPTKLRIRTALASKAWAYQSTSLPWSLRAYGFTSIMRHASSIIGFVVEYILRRDELYFGSSYSVHE